MLRLENLDFAFALLGSAAFDYLRRYYDDREADPRIELRLALAEYKAEVIGLAFG